MTWRRKTSVPGSPGLLPPGRSSLIARLAAWRRLLRIRPFDPTTPEGRSDERYRRIAWSTALSAVARLVGLATGLISVPLVGGYLSDDQYGIWLQMSSFVAALGP